MEKEVFYLPVYSIGTPGDGAKSRYGDLIRIPHVDNINMRQEEIGYIRDVLKSENNYDIPKNLVALYRLEELVTPVSRELLTTSIPLEKIVNRG